MGRTPEPGPLFFLLGMIVVFALWLLMAVLTEDAPPAASPQPQGAERGVAPLVEELPVARPRRDAEPGQGSAVIQHAAEPARPPFVWDYQLGPCLHGEPITRAEARLHLYNACQGTEQDCSWWSGVMVDI